MRTKDHILDTKEPVVIIGHKGFTSTRYLSELEKIIEVLIDIRDVLTEKNDK